MRNAVCCLSMHTTKLLGIVSERIQILYALMEYQLMVITILVPSLCVVLYQYYTMQKSSTGTHIILAVYASMANKVKVGRILFIYRKNSTKKDKEGGFRTIYAIT